MASKTIRTHKTTGAGYYKPENIEYFKQALNDAREAIRGGARLRVSVSAKNRKMGDVASVSVLPFITCPARCAKTCGASCYAAKIALLYKNTLKAYARNTALLIETPGEFWRQVEAAIMGARFFRLNVSGDILNADYFKNACEIAARQSHCKILMFTKRYEIVNAYIKNGGEIPENLRVIFSAWEGLKPINPYKLPESSVIMPDAETIPQNWKICGGNCFECFAAGAGCLGLKTGETVAFHLH